MKRVIVAAETRGRTWKYNAKPVQNNMNEQALNEHTKRVKKAQEEGKTTPVFRKANQNQSMLDFNKDYFIKDETVFALDNTDPIALKSGFMLMDPVRSEVYKRVDAHPLFDKLGPHSAEIISIAIKHGRGIRCGDKLLKFSTFLKVNVEKAIITMITVPTTSTLIKDM